MKLIRLIFSICIFLSILIFTNATNINLDINENLNVNELGGGQVEIIANGIINIENPTLTSLIYEYSFKFKDEINFQLNLNSTNITNSNKKIIGRELKPNQTKIINYQLKGIIPKTDYNQFYSSKKTLFEWYSKQIEFNPLRFATLNKLDKVKDFSNGTFQRYVVIKGSNPSEFNVNILYLDLFKTQSTNNLSKILGTQDLLETYENISLNPNQTFEFKYLDGNSNDKTTYWIEYDILAKINLSSKFIINYHSLSGGGGSSSSNNNDDNEAEEEIIIEKPLIFKKNSDKNILSYNDDLKIILEIQNPNKFSIENILILDEINNNFDLISALTENTKINKNKLSFIVEKINSFETKKIEYDLKFSNLVQTPILYFPPSKLSYKNENIYSNSLNIINDIETQDKRIFIQKEIEYVDSNTNRVHIKVKNIGDVDFTNLVIVESDGKIIVDNQNSNNLNKWKIPKLKIGDEWTTFYDIKAEDVNKLIPEIYGADDAKIYKTIVLNEKIDTLPIQDNKSKYQIVIVSLAIILLIVDIVF